MLRIKILIYSIFLLPALAISQSLDIVINQHHYQIDEDRKMIVSHIDNISDYQDLSDVTDLTILFDGEAFVFDENPDDITYSESYSVSSASTSYTLYFTELPLISIISQNDIVDEPKMPAAFIYSDSDQVINATIGIEIRGGLSQTFPKKTYDIEFWEDVSGEESIDVSFGNLRKDDDWILDGLYNEPLRLRSYNAHKLWLNMHTLYYQEEEPKAKSGADVMYAEVFLEGRYLGLYNISEQIDRKLLRIQKAEPDIKGELYKAIYWDEVILYEGIKDYDNEKREWGGWEYKYPKDITDWTNIHDFTEFIVHSSDDSLSSELSERIDVNNLSDYFIFMNVLRALDNRGKNIYLARYDQGEPYIQIPWDLDGTFGLSWSGAEDPVTEGPISNRLYDRMMEVDPNDYLSMLKDKWSDYRTNILRTESLQDSLTTLYNYFNTNNIYEREAIVYPEFEYPESKLTYTHAWLMSRLDYLDSYFSSLSQTVPIKRHDVSLLYPKPAAGKIYIQDYKDYLGQNVEIYTMSGHKVRSHTITGKEIDLAFLHSGTYVFVLGDKSYKIIVR